MNNVSVCRRRDFTKHLILNGIVSVASGNLYYFAYGAAVSEVVIDTLTGEYRILQTDIYMTPETA